MSIGHEEVKRHQLWRNEIDTPVRPVPLRSLVRRRPLVVVLWLLVVAALVALAVAAISRA